MENETHVSVILTEEGHVEVYTGTKLVADLYGPGKAPVDRLTIRLLAEDDQFPVVPSESNEIVLQRVKPAIESSLVP